jgi:hypothetical protein
MSERFDQPALKCGKCGAVIQDNEGQPILKRRRALLICLACAIKASPPKAKKLKPKLGEKIEGQLEIDRDHTIKI